MSILEVNNVSKSFGGVKANVDISMSVEKGKIVGLIGPNGSGKTTLFNSIVGTYPIDKNLNRSFLISRMVGRKWNEQFPKKLTRYGPEKLSVNRLTRNAMFEDVSFNLRAGEIVGLAGLVGAGRTEICKCIIGASSFDSGTVAIDSQTVRAQFFQINPSTKAACHQSLDFVSATLCAPTLSLEA